MDDDFNTPEATAALQGLVTEINRAKDANDWGKASALAAELKKLGGVLGVLYLQPDEFLRRTKSGGPVGAVGRRRRAADRRAPRGPRGPELQGVGPDPRRAHEGRHHP